MEKEKGTFVEILMKIQTLKMRVSSSFLDNILGPETEFKNWFLFTYFNENINQTIPNWDPEFVDEVYLKIFPEEPIHKDVNKSRSNRLKKSRIVSWIASCYREDDFYSVWEKLPQFINTRFVRYLRKP